MEPKGEIILYQPDNTLKLEVRLEADTVWLTQQQIAEQFGVGQPAISKHLKNIYASGELSEYTLPPSQQLLLDINRHNRQYPPVELRECHKVHDRFVIIDNAVYHLGASLKDLGKKLFAFTRMSISKADLINHIA